MATDGQEKTPNEILTLGADFAAALLPLEAISLSAVTVYVTNLMTDATVAGVYQSGSKALTGSILTAKFQGGVAGDIYEIRFHTGVTNFGNAYDAYQNLVITNSPTSQNLLVNRDEVKRAAGVAADDTSDDALLDDIIAGVSAYIRSRTKREFAFSKYTERVEIFEDENDELVRLKNFPLVAIDSITQVCAGVTETPITDPFHFHFDAEGFVWMTGDYRWYCSPDYQLVTYRAGLPRVPDDLKAAARKLCSLVYREVGKEGLESEAIGDYKYVKPSAIMRLYPDKVPDAFIESTIIRHTKIDIGTTQ